MKKLIATFKEKNLELGEDNIDKIMGITRYNDAKHFEFLIELYKMNGKAVVKDFKEELRISDNAYYSRELNLSEIGLVKVIPKEESSFWSREIQLNDLVTSWFKKNYRLV